MKFMYCELISFYFIWKGKLYYFYLEKTINDKKINKNLDNLNLKKKELFKK